MRSVRLLDCAGRRRSPATLSGFHRGQPRAIRDCATRRTPRNVEEIIAVMRVAGDRPEGLRRRGMIIVLWRAGLRISEALALQESDLDRTRGAVLVRRGKGGKRREVGMDRWAWEQLDPVADHPRRAAGRRAVLRAPRTHPWPPVLFIWDARSTVRHGTGRRGSPAVRATAAPPRPCGRDESRGSPARGHPTAARPRRPRDHIHVPARDRQHRNYPHRPRTARTDDSGNQRTHVGALTTPAGPRRSSGEHRIQTPCSPDAKQTSQLSPSVTAHTGRGASA